MALMTDERRKEMEEEMSRFEQEIAIPEDDLTPKKTKQDAKPKTEDTPKSSSTSTTLLPSVLRPPPPPPPPAPSSPQPQPSHRHPLPPPPPPPSVLRPPPMLNTVRFIPPQLRQAPRPMRHPFLAMRVPMGFQHHMQMPFAPMHPHPHHMQHMHMGAMGPMGMGLPMPPGFCPPGPPMHHMPNMNRLPDPYVPSMMANIPNDRSENTQPEVQTEISEHETVHTAAPAVYAAPPMKSHSEKTSEGHLSRNGEITEVNTYTSVVLPQPFDKPLVSKPTEETAISVPQTNPNPEESIVSKKKEKKKKIVRMAGGQAWEDNSLLEWESDDFRIFCGDLGNDVTDEVLIRAFSKFPSFVKAKVIRDKRTNKTKGYGFVSFKDPQDFIRAMREMNGRYVGSRPIKLRKSTWRDRNIDIVRKKQKEKEKLGLL